MAKMRPVRLVYDTTPKKANDTTSSETNQISTKDKTTPSKGVEDHSNNDADTQSAMSATSVSNSKAVKESGPVATYEPYDSDIDSREAGMKQSVEHDGDQSEKDAGDKSIADSTGATEEGRRVGEGDEKSHTADGGGNQSLALVSMDNTMIESSDLLIGVRDGLVQQRARRLDMRGEKLNLMCVGEPGLGKKSLVSALFGIDEREGNGGGSVDGVSVKVKVVDVDDHNYVVAEILQNLEEGFEKAMEREASVQRLDYEGLDEELGVDVVLYFISPHHMKQHDVNLMRTLSKRVAIIPVLAKADSMTMEELSQFKTDVTFRLSEAGVETFRTPFAVITARMERSPSGKLRFAKGRSYPWGIAFSEQSDHSELSSLRKCLLHEDLLELHASRRRNYEKYRAEKLDRFYAARRGFGALVQSMRNQVVKVTVHTIIGLAVLLMAHEYAEHHMVSIRRDPTSPSGFRLYHRRRGEPGIDEDRRGRTKRIENNRSGLWSIFTPPKAQVVEEKPKKKPLFLRVARKFARGVMSFLRNHHTEEKEPERRGLFGSSGRGNDKGDAERMAESSRASTDRPRSLFGRFAQIG